MQWETEVTFSGAADEGEERGAMARFLSARMWRSLSGRSGEIPGRGPVERADHRSPRPVPVG